VANRTVSVILALKNSGFIAGLKEADRKSRDFAKGIEDGARKNKADLDQVSGKLAGIGLAAGAGVAVAVKKFADFDAQMSKVKAATHETAGNMEVLRQAAIKAGEDTAFSATEAAAGIENLAKAGVSTKDILAGGLAGALDLAAAGELGVAEAAETAATAMTQFKLQGKDVPHIADLLAAGAGKAQGEVSDMAAALNQSGLVAAQMGLSIEETTGTLAAFASAGLLGSDAGTSFKTMLLRLANPAGEAADTMEELGIHAYDAQGAFIGIAPLAEQLKSKMANLSQEQRDAAMATIFGSDAIRAANVLYEQGAGGITNWTTKVNDQGFAAETAAIKTDNLKGDIERLGGSFDTFLIKMGEGANGPMRDAVRALTGLVDGFSALPGPAKSALLAIAGITAITGLSAAGILKIVTGVTNLKTAFQNLGRAGRAMTLSMGAVGIALLAAGAIYAAFAKRNEEAKQKSEDLRATLDEQTGAITGNTRAYVANELAQSGMAESAKGFGLSLSQVTDAALGNETALSAVTRQLDAIIESGDRYQRGSQDSAMNKNAEAAKRLKGELLGTNASLTDAQKKQKLAAEGAAEHQTAQEKQAAAVKASNKQIQDQTEKLKANTEAAFKAAGNALSLRAAQADYAESLGAVNKALEENGRGLSVTTEKGRANRAVLDEVASSANDVTESMLANGRSHEDARKNAERLRAKFVEVAIRMGLNKAAAKALADKLIAIPPKATTNVTNNAEKAKAKVNDYQKYGLNALSKEKSTAISLTGIPKANQDLSSWNTRLSGVDTDIPTHLRTTGIPLAKKQISDFGQQVDKTLGGISDQQVNVWTNYFSKDPSVGVRVLGRATGGSVFGAGTATSDSIPAMLSNGEHVWTAREVQAAGGHGAVEDMRRGVLGFAEGGAVALKMAAKVPTLSTIAGVAGDLVKLIGRDVAKKQASMGFNPGLAGALDFGRSQAGKPYLWGGVGPGGYDCSGFLSALVNVAQGRNPYARRFATGNMPAGLFTPGAGAFSVGWFRGNPGHTAGTINGVNVESRGGEGVVVGSRARGAGSSLFNSGIYHLKGFAEGGRVGDAPFDVLSPRGRHFLGRDDVDLEQALRRGPLLRDQGGSLPTGTSLVQNNTGAAEYVMPGGYVQTRSTGSVTVAAPQVHTGPTYLEVHVEVGGEVKRVVRSEVKAMNREAAQAFGIGG